MTIIDFKNTLDTFNCDLQESGNTAGYTKAVSNLVTEFYADKVKQPHEELVTEILTFLVTLE
jgi:hypothetical protein